MLAAVRAPDADVGPVMTRILPIEAVDIQDVPSVRRPRGAEVEMVGMTGNADAVRSVDVAGTDLIALRAGQMEGDSFAVRTKAEAIRQPFTGAGELAGVGPIQTDVEDLPDLVANDLHQDSVIAHQERLA